MALHPYIIKVKTVTTQSFTQESLGKLSGHPPFPDVISKTRLTEAQEIKSDATV